jgi:outer membrane protein TolC
LEKRPDIRSLVSQVQAARYNKSYNRALYYPSLDLVGNYYLDRSGTNLKDSKWDAGLNLSIPIFEGGLSSAQVGEAAAKLHEQELLLAQARRSAEVEIRVAYTELQKSLNQVRLLKEAVETATAAYQGLNKDYRHGLATNIDVLTAMTKQLDAKRSYDTNRYALEVAKASLDNSVGEIFSLHK